ncbi:CDP-alcohol phosphatidyltransferase family protein [Spiractinospora alimapuensis]|uniref:CDP-alcohol phosphatidyltransferase family protein n=1 Tax=Spiractinospora alimapuensis TaxID=2820884 RepID=UPI001F2C3180|nr:CDP-alcohol phosphatidyltransferase family protein [Spiractinospora alimapuensis]QVQ54284.1 CDP-alcohol phosphatidyltransferase family protein [Spiractinospora alimapuensis]
MARNYTLAEVKGTYKKLDSWWTVFLVDPLAGRLVVLTANHTSLTPNHLTLGAGLLGVGSAVSFAMGTWPWLVLGAVLFHLSFVLDCMDGKIARLKGTGSEFGGWVDFIFDRVRFFGCMMALMIGQWAHTGEVLYLLLAPVAAFVDLLRYLNGPQVAATRRKLFLVEHPEAVEASRDAEPVSAEDESAEPQGAEPTSVATPAGAGGGVRACLARHRVRTHLVSGIEFEMAVCVVAPLTAIITLVSPLHSLIGTVTVLATVGLLLFEAVIVYRLWRYARRVTAARRAAH